MAEKDSAYDSAANKPNMFKPPSLSSVGSGGTGSKCGDQQNNSFGGYYQNVTQKSKLILPTVIWILIVVAGLCFLSLLSSLNKTLNTLETLVEIEQSNAQLNEQHNRLHKSPSRLELFPLTDPSLNATNADPSSSFATWLSLPSWTSLEPKQSARPRDEKEKESPKIYRTLIDELLSREETPNGGEVVIASSSRELGNDEIDLGGAAKDNPIGDLIEQLVEGSPAASQAIEFLPLDSKFGPQPWAGSLDENNAPKMNDIPWSHQRVPSRLHRPLTRHEHHSHPHPHQMQPIMPELPLFMSPSDFGHEMNSIERQKPFKLDDFIPPSMFGRPNKQPQLIIELGAEDSANSESGKGGKKAKQQVGASPYEFMFKGMIEDDLPTKHDGNSKMEISDADLINSFAQALLQAQDSQQVSGDKKQQSAEENKDDPMVIINGASLGDDKRKSLPAKEISAFADKETFPIGDLFGLLFGQAPGSKSVVAPPRVVEPKEFERKQVGSDNQRHPTVDDKETAAANASLEVGKTGSPVITLLSNRPSTNQPEGALDQKIVDEMLGDILSMAQFEGNNRQPISVEAQSSDSGKESVSTISLDSSTSPTTTTTAAPSLETTKSSTPLSSSISFTASEEVRPVDPFNQQPIELVPVFESLSSDTQTLAETKPMTLQPQTTQPPISTTTTPTPNHRFEAAQTSPTTLKLESTSMDPSTSLSSTAKITTTTEQPTQEPTKSTSQQSSTTSQNETTQAPIKSFLKRADDFIQRNILNFRKFLN